MGITGTPYPLHLLPDNGTIVEWRASVVSSFRAFPHRVTQRGNRRQQVFFGPSDDQLYRDMLAERCRKASVDVWPYCLMPNHVHLVLTPHTEGGLARAIGETHRQYIGFTNARARWTGYLFQDRSRR